MNKVLRLLLFVFFMFLIVPNVYATNINIQILDGKLLTLDVDLSATVSSIKEKIHIQEGISSKEQTLIYGGTQLEDNRTLKDYNILKNSTIHLAVKKYSIIIEKVQNGTINANNVFVESNKTITLNIKPSNGYILDKINFYKATGEEISDIISYDNKKNTFRMPDYDIKIIPIFKEISYKIVTNTLEHGSVTVSKTLANKNEIITLLINPNIEYEVSNIKILDLASEKDISDSISYNNNNNTFKMPGCDIKIIIELNKIKYKINVNKTDNGTIVVNELATKDEVINIQVHPDKNYKIESLKIIRDSDNIVVNDIVKYNNVDNTFIMPNYNIQIIPVFKGEDIAIQLNKKKIELNSKEDLMVTTNGDYQLLVGIYINDSVLSSDNYTIDQNNNIFIQNKYINTLEVGKYNLKIVFDYNDVSTSFSLVKTNNTYIYVIILIVVVILILIAFGGILVIKKIKARTN